MARGVLPVGLGEKIYVPFPILSLRCQRDRATGAPTDLCPPVSISSACHGGAGGIRGRCHLLSLALLASFCPLSPPPGHPRCPLAVSILPVQPAGVRALQALVQTPGLSTFGIWGATEQQRRGIKK